MSSAHPPSFPEATLDFKNQKGQNIKGILASVDARASSSSSPASTSSSPPSPCAIICHGMLMDKNALFYPALSTALLSHCSAKISHVYRFDFSGMGESEGEFAYGGYAQMVREIASAVDMLTERGLAVRYLIGHSMGSNAVLLYGSMYSNVANIIGLSARFDMMVETRFTHADLMQLVKDGVMYWPIPGRPKPIPITVETFRERVQLDMAVVRAIGQKSAVVHSLIFHGTQDDIIPFDDALRLHHCITAQRDLRINASSSSSSAKPSLDVTLSKASISDGSGLETSMDPKAKSSLFSLDESKTWSSDTTITASSFTPTLDHSCAHAMVKIPRGDHMYRKPETREIMLQTICLWINENQHHAANTKHNACL